MVASKGMATGWLSSIVFWWNTKSLGSERLGVPDEEEHASPGELFSVVGEGDYARVGLGRIQVGHMPRLRVAAERHTLRSRIP